MFLVRFKCTFLHFSNITHLDNGTSDPFDTVPMTPQEISTRMVLFAHGSLEAGGTELFYHHEHADNGEHKDVVNYTAINSIPRNISCIRFVTHGLDPVARDSNNPSKFWTAMTDALLRAVSTNMHAYFNDNYIYFLFLLFLTNILTRYNIICKDLQCDVVSVNWHMGAAYIGQGGRGYLQAAANTKVIGHQICLVVKAIKQARPKMKFHLIGFSLGAQTEL